jgi:hypothetical protein
MYLKCLGQLLLNLQYNLFFDYMGHENEGTTIFRSVVTIFFQREILSFRKMWIFTQSKQQFGVSVLRNYLAYSNALLPPRATFPDLLVLVLDYSELQLYTGTHKVISLFKSLRHIKPGTDFHHTKISDASTFWISCNSSVGRWRKNYVR